MTTAIFTSEQINDATDRIFEEVRAKVEEIVRHDWEHCADGYRAVRILTDGTVHEVREASRLIPESEYYSRAPHPLTVWEDTRNNPGADVVGGPFPWREDPDGKYLGDFETCEYVEYADVEADETGKLFVERGLRDEREIPANWTRFSLDYNDPVDDLLGEDAFSDKETLAAIREWIEAGNLAPDFLVNND